MIHGILDSADDFVLNKNKDSNLANFFIEENMDLWLVNIRGNKYSCGHRHLDTESKEFWNFSFHEVGLYDLPAVVNYVYKQTQQKVTLVAHSQGTSSVFAGLAMNPDLQKYINSFYALAPVAFFKGIDEKDTIYFYLASHHYVKILKFFGIHKLAQHSFNRSIIEKMALKLFCNSYYNLCDFLLRHFTDKDSKLIDKN